jgi:hypothetical protein
MFCGFARGERYNMPNPSLPEVGDQSLPKIVNLAPAHFQRDPMPFEHSDAVVVGTIKAGQAWASLSFQRQTKYLHGIWSLSRRSLENTDRSLRSLG